MVSEQIPQISVLCIVQTIDSVYVLWTGEGNQGTWSGGGI